MTSPKPRAFRPEIWFNAVSAICPECGERINGKHHVTVAGQVVMRQFCPHHGHRAVLVSTDYEWFTRYEQLAAVLPPRPERNVPEGVCCIPEVGIEEGSDAELSRRLLWLHDASPGSVAVRAGGELDADRLAATLERARAVGYQSVTVHLPAAALLRPEVAASVEATASVAHVAAADPQLPEVLERRRGMSIALVSRLASPADQEPAALGAAWRRLREHANVVSWEIVPAGTLAAEWHKGDHHPSKGPTGEPSNGPVPRPGPVAATLSEALPHVAAATGGLLDREAFFPALRFHPPGSALALLRGGADSLAPVTGALDPRGAIDLVLGKHPAASTDPAVLAVRRLFGHPGHLHPRMLAALVAQGLGEVGGLVAEEHRRDVREVGDAACATSAQPVKTVIVHSPLGRANFDRNRLLRACPLPREGRECINEGCGYVK